MITVSIEAGKIPKHMIVEKNGKKYINIVVDSRKEPDQYGNTHSVYMSQTKEQREAKEAKTYIGSGKEFVFNNNTTTPANNSPENVDDLPF